MICSEGFSYAWIWRHHDPPEIRDDAGPVNNRLIALSNFLPAGTNLFMDNFYISGKCATMMYNGTPLPDGTKTPRIHIAGVCRSDKRGLPKMVKQTKLSSEKAIAKVKGTVLVSSHKTVKPLVAVSLYDSKPVYFLSTVDAAITYVHMRRGTWDNESKSLMIEEFKRLKIVWAYNAYMGYVDVADQLRLGYEFAKHLRQKKWWWPIWRMQMGMAMTNMWCLYRSKEEQTKVRSLFPLLYDALATDTHNISHLSHCLPRRSLCGGRNSSNQLLTVCSRGTRLGSRNRRVRQQQALRAARYSGCPRTTWRTPGVQDSGTMSSTGCAMSRLGMMSAASGAISRRRRIGRALTFFAARATICLSALRRVSTSSMTLTWVRR